MPTRRRDASMLTAPGARRVRPRPDTEAVRRSLLETAEECFERYGLTRTSMDDIAAAAEVSRPTLYRYFGDRDTLVTEIVQSRSRRLVTHFHALVARYDDHEDKLVHGLLYLVRHSRRDQFVSLLLGPENFAYATSLLLRDGAHGFEFAGWCWRPVIEAGIDAGAYRADLDVDAAIHWLASFTFTLISWLDGDDRARPRAWQERMLRDFAVAGFFGRSRPGVG